MAAVPSSKAIHASCPSLTSQSILISMATALSVSTSGHTKTFAFKFPGSPCVDNFVQFASGKGVNDNVSRSDSIVKWTRNGTAYQNGHMPPQKGCNQGGRRVILHVYSLESSSVRILCDNDQFSGHVEDRSYPIFPYAEGRIHDCLAPLSQEEHQTCQECKLRRVGVNLLDYRKKYMPVARRGNGKESQLCD